MSHHSKIGTAADGTVLCLRVRHPLLLGRGHGRRLIILGGVYSVVCRGWTNGCLRRTPEINVNTEIQNIFSFRCQSESKPAVMCVGGSGGGFREGVWGEGDGGRV